MTSRLAWAPVVIAVVLGAGADPAVAHTLTGVEPTNYRSELITITPRVTGLEVEVLDVGRRVRLTNTDAIDITVLGYQGEAYLRVGPEGVYENRNSPTLYANRTPAEPLPDSADVNGSPEWRRIDTGTTVTWRDRRTRWEGEDPPEVADAPDQRHVVSNWHIRLERGTETIDLVGRITWVPGPSSTPWIAITAVVAAAAAATGWSRRWVALLGALLGGLIAVDLVNAAASVATTIDAPLSVAASTLLRDPLATLAWLAGGAALASLHRRPKIALLLAGAAGWIFAATSAATDTGAFGRSQIPTRLAPGLARSYVALTIGLGVGVAVAAITAASRNGWMPWVRRRPALRRIGTQR